MLRLLACMVLAVALMVLDHRSHWLQSVRSQLESAMQPLWWAAGLPSRLGAAVRSDAVTRAQLSEDNRRLRQALLVASARNARVQTLAAENARLHGLLGSAQRGALSVQLARVLDIDLDPTRQRLVLDAGSRSGVRVGQSVIDAGGLLGQVTAVSPFTATVLLLTDPDHVVPVLNARTGARLLVYGVGRSDRLRLANAPLSTDIQAGDRLLTSGLGLRFPPGFEVGTVLTVTADDSRAFLEGDVRPAAQLDRGLDVLLLRDAPAPAVAPAQAPAAATTAGEPPAAAAEPVP